jgi:hypothetical protein
MGQGRSEKRKAQLSHEGWRMAPQMARRTIQACSQRHFAPDETNWIATALRASQ